MRIFGTNVEFSSSLLPTHEKLDGIYQFPEQLSIFNFEGQVVRSRLYSIFPEAVVQWSLSRVGQIDRALCDLFSNRPGWGSFKISSDKNLRIHELLEKPPMVVNHPLMNFKIAERYAPVIAKQITELKLPSTWYRETAERLQNTNPIAIHVRLGDHARLGNSDVQIQYYSRAIELLRRGVGNRPVWLFSDNPLQAHDILKGSVHIDFVVEHPLHSNSVENLNLMAMCRGIVISASTFSWWAGMIGKTRGSEVVAPVQFNDFPGAVFNTTFIPATWLRT